MATDELFTVNHAATVLAIRPWTLRHWISDRKVGSGEVRKRRRPYQAKRA
jgi:hypothetical protein